MEMASRDTPQPTTTPYPTTFVTADSSSFKQVVQMLTGSDTPKSPAPSGKPPASSDHPHPSSRAPSVIPPVKTAPGKKPGAGGFKLYERRMKSNLLVISPGSRLPPPEILSPSVLDFPSLTLSPVTPLDDHQSSEEERAIAEKGYYLHPSPMSTPRDAQPQLLPLFPLTSPRVSDPSSSTS